MTPSGWIGVDLDGTLAEYHGWNGGEIGQPVIAMVQRVRKWIAEGIAVKIMTARVGLAGGYSLESNRYADKTFAQEQEKLIQDWCEEHIGKRLEVTASKDFTMIELWDDRAVRVEMNTGRVISNENS